MAKHSLITRTFLLSLQLISTALARSIPGTVVQDVESSGTSGTIQTIMNKTMTAMGGDAMLKDLRTLSYQAESIFRSHSLHQNYDLFFADQSVSAAGTQNMTFDLSSNGLRSRIDRSYVYDDYWYWAFPELQPAINYSVIVQDGHDGFACFTHGQNSFFTSDPSVPLGYADPYLADYLVHQSHQFALPWLFSRFMSDLSQLKLSHVRDPVSQQTYRVISDPSLGLAILIDTKSNLPYAIRSQQNHVVFGSSTSDLVLSAWAKVGSGNTTMLFPHRFQTIYNSQAMLEDFIVTSVVMNTELPGNYFEAHIAPHPSGGQSQTSTKPSKPARNPEYPRSEVHESFEAGLWNGPFGEIFGVSDVTTGRPIAGVGEISTIYIGYPDYVQLLIEFEDGLLIADAPPHRSKIILDWVESNMHGKKITHVVPSHHHRDHAGGVPDFLAAGATLVIPEIATGLYNFTGDIARIVTYNEDHPFVKKDSKVQFRSFWKDENPHARDWSYGVAAPVNPTSDSDFVVLNADVVSPGTDATRWDTAGAFSFFASAVDAGIPPEAILVGTHGSSHGGTSTSEVLARLAERQWVRISAAYCKGLDCEESVREQSNQAQLLREKLCRMTYCILRRLNFIAVGDRSRGVVDI